MEQEKLVTEADINAKLAELKGKVPTVVINDLREKLMARKGSITYEQLEKIVQRVLEAYGSQAARYEQLSKRVDELGKKLTDLSLQLSRLVDTLEATKFGVQEKKAETVSKKVEEVHEKVEKLEELLEEGEEAPEQLTEKIEKIHEKLEEIAEKVETQTVAKKLEETQEKLEEIHEKVEAGVSEEKLATAENSTAGETKELVEREEVEKPEVVEIAPEEVAHEEGGVKMTKTEKIQIPRDIASLLFEEEPKKARLEKLPEDIASTMIALKWLGFLIDRVGIQNLEKVLEFYYEIGWISEEVLNQLLCYAKGTRPHHRDPEWKPAEKLTIQDHIINLLFIERLRGLRISRHVLDKLEREIKILERTLDEFYGI